jgi:ketosteroid isomerase-like protein
MIAFASIGEPAINNVEGQAMHAADSESEDIAKLRDMAREFTEGFNTGDVDRIMRFYGDTYVDINLRDPVQSWQERREYYCQVMRSGEIRVQVRPDEILIRGDFAFVRGSIELIDSSAIGDAPPSELRYLEIARRLKDGSWQVVWGMDGPVQEYTPKT